MRRATSVGRNPKRIMEIAFQFYGCFKFEGGPPLQGGFIRRKVRTERRRGFAVENPFRSSIRAGPGSSPPRMAACSRTPGGSGASTSASGASKTRPQRLTWTRPCGPGRAGTGEGSRQRSRSGPERHPIPRSIPPYYPTPSRSPVLGSRPVSRKPFRTPVSPRTMKHGGHEGFPSPRSFLRRRARFAALTARIFTATAGYRDLGEAAFVRRPRAGPRRTDRVPMRPQAPTTAAPVSSSATRTGPKGWSSSRARTKAPR